MDDIGFSPNNMFGNPAESMMDFDYMDELLLDGCWLQASDGSEFINNINNNIPIFDPLFPWPTLGLNNIPHLPEDVQEERAKSSNVNNISVSQSQTEDGSKTDYSKSVGFQNQSGNFLENSETNQTWWIPPSMKISVRDRLIHAIENIKHSTLHKNMLIQIWLPENREGKKVLSTSDKLFSLGPDCPQLSNYRNISKGFHFAAEGDSKHIVGLPGRVFMDKVPEWTPDVRFFKTEEYPRVGHAQQFDVRGSVAVPIFDQDSQSCIGVIEVVMTTQKTNYTPEIEGVCKALEAVDLRSSESASAQKFKVSDGLYEAALPEILEILKSACKTHGLPLAQTWVPCIQQGKGGCRHSDANLIDCISTVDDACYVHDSRFKEFQEACSEHHLLKGQGAVGTAFKTNQPCYLPDVKMKTKTEYPLSHHARIFGLCGVVAIRLRNTYTGNIDYVLEFFLPVDCKDQEKQKSLLNSLSVVIQNVGRNLRIVTDKELLEEGLTVSASVEKVLKVEEIVTEQSVDLIDKQVNDSGSGEGNLGNSFNDGIKRPERRRGGSKTEKTITLEMLRQYFAGSLKDAAKHLGVCPTTLKRICRQHGIQRWPSRKIKKVGHSLQKIQLVMDSVHGAPGSFQIESFYTNFPNLASPDQKTSSVSPLKLQMIDSNVFEGVTKSLSPSCSQTSSSGHSSSSGTHLYPHPHTPTGADIRKNVLKRTRSDAEVHVSIYSRDKDRDTDQEPEQKVFQRSHSHKLLTEFPTTSALPPKARDENVQRVKVTYGEEKIRFRLQKDGGYSQLLEEIAKRFSINNIHEFHLKYFDDDSEWVLLTCDADLEECIDVYRSCKSGTIRLALLEPHQVGGSLGSNVFL
ncbi:protein NLP5-like [Rutidosis leptorrhynchoides]|uniref:protein NLP5-like n=1 Tax=Rutidosis leptorrhynchoides TaxID=125765 RepID=UPI003A99D838